jgi:glycopeptide antibiotics resistance protein
MPSPDRFLDKIEKTAPAIVFVSIAIVFIATLFPFRFSFYQGISLDYILDSFYTPSSPGDLIANILLFAPLGFGLAAWWPKQNLRKMAVWLGLSAILIGFILSLTVEILQVYIITRSPTITDLITNSVGTGLGFLSFHLWRLSILHQFSKLQFLWQDLLASKTLSASLIGYVLAMSLLSIALQKSTNLSNWDESLPLLLGNELTGDRAWEGQIADVCLANRAASTEDIAKLFNSGSACTGINDSLVAAYDFTGTNNYRDRTGNLPELTWIGKPEKISDRSLSNGVFVGKKAWLQSQETQINLVKKLSSTSQFTLSAKVTPSRIDQVGPARIISISRDSFHRNLTIGQLGQTLVLRLRTPLMGSNGKRPEINISKVFKDTKTHQIAIVYDRDLLKIYIDNIPSVRQLNLTPDINLFLYLLHIFDGQIDLRTFNPSLYQWYYRLLVFLPLGAIVGLLAGSAIGRWFFYVILMFGGIIVPAAILEILCWSQGNGFIDSTWLVRSISIASIAALASYAIGKIYRMKKV